VRTVLDAGGIDGVLHFSRRSAEAYVECARDALGSALAPVHYCLSARAAAPLQAAGAAQIRIAARPDEAGMLALLDSG
jgi:uroporphyrinogen-III synthase